MEKLRQFMTESAILALGRSIQQAAPLDLRVNTHLANRDEVIAALQRCGISEAATSYSPVGVRVVGKPAINRHELFLNGKVEVQDEGANFSAICLLPNGATWSSISARAPVARH